MNIKKLTWFAGTQLLKFQYGRIGKKSYLGKTLFVQRKKNMFIGDNTRIYPGMRAEITKPSASVYIGNNVSIGQNFHVVSYDDKLIIEDDVVISGNVFISNVDHDYREIGKHLYNQAMLSKKTFVGMGTFIGYGAVILPGTTLGKQCVIGANSVVKGNYPDYCVIVGAPASVIRQYNPQSGEWERK